MDETAALEYDIGVLGAEDVQRFLGKSLSWVYEHYQELGGTKVGGAILFPSERKIYERLFRKEDGDVHVRLPVQPSEIHRKRIQNQSGGSPGGGGKPKVREIAKWQADTNRHGIF